MPSLIPGYEYDIFISYRQKDNKGDGWVTEFVNALKTELESTFKEDVSVYFDINPHDGLLETHDVDASLKEKLKCLIFIPIISRTYCDPKSFAWEHEFKAFVEQASQDQFGLKVKLAGGNVANRVLPVQIHDLNADDRKLVEGELGGYLRGIEFIYKEPGVNRPLTPEDDEKKNLNNTRYRNQINKVSNAINEIIDGLKHTDNLGKGISEKIVEEKPSGKINKKINIITGAIILLTLVMAGYFIYSKLIKPDEQLEKSIAVLPFFNDSPDQENAYFINGIMDEVLNNLQGIGAFSRVLSRPSVEQFRNNTTISTPEIAKKLDVNYIVVGSGQKYGNKFRLRVQLIRAKGKESHLWGKSYDREINQTTDIISVQSEIAQLIATELKAIITPEEKELIEKIPTENLSAYDYFLKGKNELINYWLNSDNKAALTLAENYYNNVLKYDSNFAPAYSGLALVYRNQHRLDTVSYFTENYQDTIRVLAEKALSIDNKLAEGYYVLGLYYLDNGRIDQAINEFDNALKYNPNYWEVYATKGRDIYLSGNTSDFVKSIENLDKAIGLNKGKELQGLFISLSTAYFIAGFTEKYLYYSTEASKQIGDTNRILYYKYTLELYSGNFNKAMKFINECNRMDTNNIDVFRSMGFCYSLLGQYKESLKYYKKYIKRSEDLGHNRINSMHRIAYAYWQNGLKEEASYYFNKQKRICEEALQKGRKYGTDLSAYYDLASIYAFEGDKKKAYVNLNEWNNRSVTAYWWLFYIKYDPLFNSIRNEPEFQKIARDAESKYQTEHERVRKWLEENNML